jgi:NAD(P)-dependent dehydrogenase (short-subunit alcohol dehydrogenase family)
MDLHGKVALITGGTLGIGAAIARDLAKRGAHIAVVARNLGEPADELRREIEGLGRKFLACVADMSVEADCLASVEETVRALGRLDVLVHNAGGPSHGRIEEVTPQQWRQTMALHVDALFYLCQAALPHLKKQSEGAIVTVSSTAGVRGVAGAIAYATAKGAVPQFTRCLAREVADFNIRVNCVAPGVIRTRFHDDMTPERKKLNLEQRIPLHREGTSEQVAEVVSLLATNDYLTGETFVIDGGLTSRIA